MKFSIIIPTRDRPALLAVVVKYAMQQQYRDFEVIVSDNSSSDDFKRANADALHGYLGAANFKLVRPPREVSLPENFEFALGFATGDHVAYLTDKMVMLPHALADASAAIKESSADIVNWAYASYFIESSKHPTGSGTLVEEFAFLGAQPELFDPIAALRFKASGRVRRNRQGTKDYLLGKIVFGSFSRQLIDRIRATSGTLFAGVTHDYTAMVQALSLARSCVMLNKYEILFISLPRDQSLGSLTASEPRQALQYYRSLPNVDAVLAALPVPGVYASQHNMVAHDYKRFLPMYGKQELFSEIDWLCAVFEDLLDDSKIWADPAEKAAQMALFTDHLTRSGQRLSVQLKRFRKTARERLWEIYRRFTDPITLRVNARLRRNPTPTTARAFAAASLDEALQHLAASHASHGKLS